MNFKNFQDIDWQLLFIRTYTWLTSVFEVVRKQSVKSTRYLIRSFQPELYCFYKDSDTPVFVTDYLKDVAGAAEIEYYYNKDFKVISRTPELSHIPRTLNIEGAKIYHGDICLYDLTDFFDTTFYSGSNDVPSLSQWVGVWQLETGIYLDRSTDFRIEMEFLGESKESFQLWNNTPRWKQITATAPRLHRQSLERACRATCSCPPNHIGTSNVVYMPVSGERESQSTSLVDLSGNLSSDIPKNNVEEVPEETSSSEESHKKVE